MKDYAENPVQRARQQRDEALRDRDRWRLTAVLALASLMIVAILFLLGLSA